MFTKAITVCSEKQMNKIFSLSSKYICTTRFSLILLNWMNSCWRLFHHYSPKQLEDFLGSLSMIFSHCYPKSVLLPWGFPSNYSFLYIFPAIFFQVISLHLLSLNIPLSILLWNTWHHLIKELIFKQLNLL